MLKPVIDVVEAEWLSGVLDALPERDDLRVIRPVRSTSGAWVVDGWGAFRRLDGEPRTGAWRETLDVSRRFHALVESVARSDAVDDTDPWAIGHRFAWGEQSLDIPEALAEHVARLLRAGDGRSSFPSSSHTATCSTTSCSRRRSRRR